MTEPQEISIATVCGGGVPEALCPYRTFPQIAQPSSLCVFRLKSREGAVPLCGLFEADGGAWKVTAVDSIRAWLDAAALGMPVVA